ncbi:MAG: CDP-diacylglycerol--serine O-phosphatidyltransferase [Epsilonproteobacteria bacterium]|nr:CDP-diacylglycerol--serine O-phosphatidyltransferase [Campylobacterota bacterium]
MKNQKYSYAYILPNLLTSASIFSGILSIVNSIHGDFVQASWLIFLSLIFDGLDGRVARLTNTCSKFGLEFDSLADIVAFGVAPAILVYMYAGVDFGRFGIVVMALFVIFGAIRLARFNITSNINEPSVFIGVPIPTAAVFLALFVLLFQKYDLEYLHSVLLIISLFVSFLMVSNIRYPSFKKIDLDKKDMRKLFIGLVGILLFIFIYPIEAIVSLFSVYILYGVIRTILNFKKR